MAERRPDPSRSRLHGRDAGNDVDRDSLNGRIFALIGDLKQRRAQIQQIADRIRALPDGSRILVLGPLIKDRKTEGERVFAAARRQGFVRARVVRAGSA